MKSSVIAALFVAIGFTVAAAGSHAEGTMETTYNITPDGVAIGGWDTVAYFTQDRAVEGSLEFSHDWEGATWLFTSQENHDLFVLTHQVLLNEALVTTVRSRIWETT